jgi:hypothetical protein
MKKYMSGGDVKKVKSIAKSEVEGHEKRMHKYAKGGVTNSQRAKFGRNMARVMNQRSKS